MVGKDDAADDYLTYLSYVYIVQSHQLFVGQDDLRLRGRKRSYCRLLRGYNAY
jgi:hypothetical protein